jgi:hypothetical protein
MSNKDFYKKFEELLNEIFGDRTKPTTPIESFFDHINYEDLRPDFSKFRNSVRKTKDGLVTSFYFVINPDGEWSVPNKNLKTNLQTKLDECIKNQDYEQAAKIRDEIKELGNNSNRVKELKRELELVIEKQDFERAIEIRDELKKIN